MVLSTADWAFLYQLTDMPTGRYDGINSLFDILFLDDSRSSKSTIKTSQDTILVELLTNSQEKSTTVPSTCPVLPYRLGLPYIYDTSQA